MNSKINYKNIVDESMRNVVRDILRTVQKNGLSGEQHYYITFQTNFPGVNLSDDMRNKYPHDITIVIQHEYYNLNVLENIFSVDLSFGGIKQTIIVPFMAITAFVDPSENFGIQLEKHSYAKPSITKIEPVKEIEKKEEINEEQEDQTEEDNEENNVIALDSFRKK